MSLLMGALKNARETAKTVECMARLRSFHQWQHLYRVDNDMWFVVNRTWGPGLEGPDIPNPESPQHYDTFVNALKTYMGERLATKPTGAPPPATITFYVPATDTWSILRPLP